MKKKEKIVNIDLEDSCQREQTIDHILLTSPKE